MPKINSFQRFFWSRHANPYSGWTRTLIGTVLPIAVYTRHPLFIGIIVLCTITNPFWFSPPSESMKIDFMYHVVRGECLLMHKQIPHYAGFWSRFSAKPYSRLLFSLAGTVFGAGSLLVLWYGHLIAGSVMFYVFGMALKWSYATECANASRAAAADDFWDEILQSPKK